MKKNREKFGYPPFKTLREYDDHIRKMNFFFVLMIAYTSGVFIGFILDINLRYG